MGRADGNCRFASSRLRGCSLLSPQRSGRVFCYSRPAGSPVWRPVTVPRGLRGGSWINNSDNTRADNRNRNHPDNRNDNRCYVARPTALTVARSVAWKPRQIRQHWLFRSKRAPRENGTEHPARRQMTSQREKSVGRRCTILGRGACHGTCYGMTETSPLGPQRNRYSP
jgi:hypothetical protein